MRVLIIIFLILVYLQLGYVIASRSFRIWMAKDNRSFLAFLLYPTSFMSEKVGTRDVSIIGRLDLTRVIWADGGPGEGLYHIVMMLIWPLKVLFNVPMAVLLFLFGGVASRFIGLSSNIDKLVNKGSVRQLFAQRRRIEAKLQTLESHRERLTTAINERKEQSTGQFLLEESLDRRNAQTDVNAP